MQGPAGERARVRMIVHGDVQGVGYRAFARRVASSRGLSGYTRNLADGTVEVVAEGDRAALLSMVDVLRRGPSSAEVSDVDCEWETPTGTSGPFTIRH